MYVSRKLAAVATALAVIVPLAAGGTGAAAQSAPAGLDGFPDPVDPQSWELPEWMGWDDYRPLPAVDWNDEERQPAKKLRAALILGDFQDREFVITEEAGSDAIGGVGGMGFNPQVLPEGVDRPSRETVGDWYADFLIREPSPLNNGHTVNEYWLEDSYGKVGVDAEAFGPYRMDGKEHEYGLGGTDAGGGGQQCPKGDTCGDGGVLLVGKFDRELLEKSTVDVTAGQALNGEDYDFRYLLHAGYDESGVWQEFGEMLFATKEDVSDELGHPHNDPQNPDYTPEREQNWTDTRYVDWTSFAAGEGIWSHALPGLLSTQGENDGHSTFAHELSHIFGVLDNYNNPFASNRSYTGTWAQLSRGTFNGPGGTHNRWQIPPTLGGTMGSHHMLRNKIRLGFTPPHEVLTVDRDALAQTGPQFATIYPRAYPLAPITPDVGLHGVVVTMNDDNGIRPTPDPEHPDQYDRGGYTNYTMEFVDRIGFDSFTTDSGVLIAKNKDAVDLSPFMWAIDAHPEDINGVDGVGDHEGREIYDFVGADGVTRPIALGDARQLADALFHAGTGEGVVAEHVDEGNRLHFYVLGTETDEREVSTYRVAVRNLDGDGPFTRAVALAHDPLRPLAAAPGRVARTEFTLTNPGNGTDLVRLAVDTTLDTQLSHEVVEVPAGGSITVPVWVGIPHDAAPDDTFAVALTATSETDPSQTATATTEASADADGTEVTAASGAVRPAPTLPATGGGLALAGIAALGFATLARRSTRTAAR